MKTLKDLLAALVVFIGLFIAKAGMALASEEAREECRKATLEKLKS